MSRELWRAEFRQLASAQRTHVAGTHFVQIPQHLHLNTLCSTDLSESPGVIILRVHYNNNACSFHDDEHLATGRGRNARGGDTSEKGPGIHEYTKIKQKLSPQSDPYYVTAIAEGWGWFSQKNKPS